LHYRNKVTKTVGLLLVCLTIFISLNASKIVFSDDDINTDVKVKKTILIDPGHGGIDGGGVSRHKILEKDINLNISLMLKEELEKNGFKVIMTREKDEGLYSNRGRIRDKKNEDLKNRCLLKDNSGCDMFVSIHQNMFPQTQYYGSQVWYAKSEGSKMLGHIIQENLKVDLNNGNKRKEKPALEEYKILRCSKMPSVIVECGFLSNAEEEQKLKSEEYQRKIAQSIAKSVAQFYEE